MENIEENDEELKPFDMDKMKKDLPTYNSKKLCEIIVCDRYFGSYKDLAVIAMEELANRRIGGDSFDFELFIDTEFNKLPKLDFSIPDIGDVLRQVVNNRVKK